MRSLRSRLWVLWCLALAASAGVALLLVQLTRTSASAEMGRAEAVVASACDAIRDRYGFYVTDWNGAGSGPADPGFARDLLPVVAAALAGQTGVEGGIWSAAVGSLATAGAGTGLPRAELPAVRAANAAATTGEQSVLRRFSSGASTLLLAACPLSGPFDGLTAWTMTRVRSAQGNDRLRAGLGLLLALVLGIAGWVTWMTALWGRHVRAIESALATHDLEALPPLKRTGERELDRIVAALNDAGQRLSLARARSATMAAQIAASERMAALGRVAAGVAHEVRNPMAAMRLRIENALAGDAARHRPALETSLGQIDRVDRLLAELLAVTQRRLPECREVELSDFLAAIAVEHGDRAESRGVRLSVECPARDACFDAELVRRALDNLVLNAIRHTPAGGLVRIRAEDIADGVRIAVTDTGAGVDPSLRPRLFEPFATGRPDGTGLGLAIARELAEAHGGRLLLAEPGGSGRGASFALELPRPPPCPPS